MPGKKVELPVSPYGFDETMRRVLRVKPERVKPAPKKPQKPPTGEAKKRKP